MGNGVIIEPLSLGTVTAGSSAAGTSPSFLGNDYIGVVHRGTATLNDWVQVDLGADTGVDFAAFLSSAQTGAQTKRIRAATSAAGAGALPGTPGFDTGAFTFAAGANLPTSGRANSWWDDSTQRVFRHWRFDIGSMGGAVFEAGRLVMGRKYQPSRNFSYGAGRGAADYGTAEFTKDGALLRRFGRILRRLELSFSATSRSDVEATVLPLIERVGNTKPLLVVTDSAPDANRQPRMYFGLLQGDLMAIQRAYDVFEWRVQLLSVI